MQLSISGPTYDGVRHILTAPPLARRTAPYLGESDFDFAGLRAEAKTMSSGEALLVRIAHELWLAEKVTGLWELTQRLDEANFRRVLEGLSRCRGRLTARVAVPVKLAA
jgi:energy-coupling factor transporter ATP-binding protein EcfA2